MNENAEIEVQPQEGETEQLSSDPNDYEVDSSDVSPEALKELLGESDEQPEKDSKKELDHDKSVLGSQDDLEEIQELLGDDNKDGEESTEDSEDATEGDPSEDIAEVEVDGKSYKVPAALKNSIMMNSDYTKKTQEVAELRKSNEEFQNQLTQERESFQKEQAEFVQKNQEALSQWEAFNYATDVIKESNPDLYEEMMDEFKSALRHYSNPVVERMNKELTELKSKLTANEDNQTMSQFYTDWGKAQASVVPKLEKLGIKVDQKEVQKFWAKDMSVNQALNALYGDSLRKISESRAKVLAAKEAAAKKKKAPLTGAARTPSTGKKYNSYSDITASLLR